MGDATQRVAAFWERDACGERYATGDDLHTRFENQAKKRYELEPFIHEFARFDRGSGLDVLEIGVGMGADHMEWAKARPRSLAGIDLTERAIDFTSRRLVLYGFSSDLRVADAEHLPFTQSSFDLVYAWGVLHHSPSTPRAVEEVYRVLRSGGRALIMIYNRRSLLGYMLWIRYALLRGRFFKSLAAIYAENLESPGTQAFTVGEAHRMFRGFSEVHVSVKFSAGDELGAEAGQRHEGLVLSAARKIWPRRLLKALFPRHGLFMLIDARK